MARLMRQAGLFGCGAHRRKARTTLRSQTERTPPAPDLVKRNFTPEAPDRLWGADITYVRTWEGWLYLSFVLDTYSRRVVGWSMANNLRDCFAIGGCGLRAEVDGSTLGMPSTLRRRSPCPSPAAHTLPTFPTPSGRC